MAFEFATATRVVFGPGTARGVGTLAADLGRHALVVTGGTPARASVVLDSLSSAGLTVGTLSLPGEPTTDGIAQPDSPALPRYTRLAALLTGRPDATPADGIAWVSDLVTAVRIPSLRHYGIVREDFVGLAERAAAASSMKANPVTLTASELMGVLEAAW